MAIDVEQVFRTGGRTLFELLHFCVFTRRMDPLFAFLVGEYHNRPSTAGAWALHDAFCVRAAPARLTTTVALPPYDLRLERLMHALPARDADVRFLPDRALFDFIIAQMRKADDGPLAELGRSFDPDKTAMENLPGEALTAGQQAFLENVWRPSVRPPLVAAGFVRIATAGG